MRLTPRHRELLRALLVIAFLAAIILAGSSQLIRIP